MPPARRRRKKKKKDRFYIYSEPGKPWKARGREKRTQTTGQGRNSAGGEGNKRTSRTNLHGETDLTNTEHTPEPHIALPRGTGEELGTKWGTSWWRKRNNKIIIEGIQFKPRGSCVNPSREGSQVMPRGLKQLCKFQWIRCTKCCTSPDTKKTIPAGRGHACHLSWFMSCCSAKAGAAASKMKVSENSEQLQSSRVSGSIGSQGTTGSAGQRKKGW